MGAPRTEAAFATTTRATDGADQFAALPWLGRSLLARWGTLAATALTDLVVIAGAIALAVVVRAWTGGEVPPGIYLGLWPALGLFLALYAVNGLYADIPAPASGELRRLTTAITVGFVALAAATFLSREAESYSRIAFLTAWALAIVAAPLARAALRATCARRPWWGTPVVVLGAGECGDLVLRRLLADPARGLRPVLVLDDDPVKQGTHLHGVPVIGPIDRAPELAQRLGLRCALVAMPGAPRERLLGLWRDLGAHFPHLIVVPALLGFASLWVEAKDLGGMLGLEVRQSLLLRGPRTLKRAVDLAIVVAVAPLLLVLYLLFAAAIRIDSRGPILYGQRRLGRAGRPFTAWKFRSMRRDADQALADYLAAHPELREEWERDHKLRDDPRVTRLGRLLRKTSLDELPQLWNVLRGEMSLVGPRPIVEKEIAKYGDHYALYGQVRPGLTGLWQVSGRNNTTYDERVAFDAYYVRNWSLWLDLVILAKTVRVVVRGEGAY